MRPTTASAFPYDAPEPVFGAQAEAFLDALHAGDPKAVELFKWEHPDYAERSVSEVEGAASRGAFTPDDARLVVARSHGFADWSDLSGFLARVGTDPAVGRFEEAVEAVVDGREEELLGMLSEHPALVRARSLRRHRATLLHYLGANGVEGARQRTPRNAVRIAKLLLEAGAEVDATADLYGAPCTTLTLVVTSDPPAAAGVQADLAGALIDGGATPTGPDGSALSTVRMALSSGYLDTARVLAERAAPDLDFVTSAGLGSAADVARLLPGADAPERHVALALAAQHGHVDVLETMLDAGEDPDRLNPPGHHAHTTPLHQAVYAGHLDAVELLVERGARLDIADTIYGGTALNWARHSGHAEIEAFLAARSTGPPLN
jgi:hypothetical protein